MNISEQQFEFELNYCLMEQGFDWYNKKLDFIGLAVLGLIDLHKKDIEKLKQFLRKEEELSK